MKVFVTDGDQRPALAMTRSLGRRGVDVIVGEERPDSLASSSRYAAGHVTYPSPYRQPQSFERWLLDFAARERVDVMIPVTDVTTHAVTRRQDVLRRHSALAVPPFEAFDFVSDKGRLLERAATCGIPIPRTQVVSGLADVKRILAHVEFPAVVKPTRSRIRTDHGWRSTTVRYAASPDELLRLYEEVDYLSSSPSLIQERIVGTGLGVFVICDHGRLLTTFAHRRLREKPPSGGVSVLSESVPVDPQLRAQTMSLLGPIGWHGVAMAEYKQDKRTGRPVLMEVNGRFWGSTQLAIDAGVDFPFLSCQLALGRPPDLPPTYELGMKSRWLLGDLDHLLIRLVEGPHQPARQTWSKMRAVVEFLGGTRGSRQEVFRRDDPRPMVYELTQYARALLRLRTIPAHHDVIGARVPFGGNHVGALE